jgi:hypothetical protein
VFLFDIQDVDPATLVGNTLHSDATSKYFKHFQSYQVTLSNGNSMSIGLTEVGGADSDTMLQSFKMASIICCWATAFASISNLDFIAILGSLSGKTPDDLYKTVLMTELN